MGTEVAVESDPRLAGPGLVYKLLVFNAQPTGTVISRRLGPGTVRAWEETGIAGSISRRLSSFPDLLDLCASPLLECVHGVSGEGSPSSPVMSAGLKLLEGNFCMAYACLYTVFESLVFTICLYFTNKKLMHPL